MERLRAAAELVGRCKTVYDVGCDHGYLGLGLLERGAAQRALFCDISAPSLEKARAHAAEAGLMARCAFACCDGLPAGGLKPGEDDCVCVCGMGGRTIAAILADAAARGELPACPLVLQANTSQAELRACLHALSFAVTDMAVAFDAGRYYLLARAQYDPGEAARPAPDALDAEIGRALLQKRPQALAGYLEWRKSVCRGIIESAARGGGRAPEAERDLALVEEAMKWL